MGSAMVCSNKSALRAQGRPPMNDRHRPRHRHHDAVSPRARRCISEARRTFGGCDRGMPVFSGEQPQSRRGNSKGNLCRSRRPGSDRAGGLATWRWQPGACVALLVAGACRSHPRANGRLDGTRGSRGNRSYGRRPLGWRSRCRADCSMHCGFERKIVTIFDWFGKRQPLGRLA